MKNYAIIENAAVTNVVLWDGESEWTPPEGSVAVLVPENIAVQVGDGYADGRFVLLDRSTPILVETPEQIAMRNAATKAQLLTTAAIAIAPLQDAVDLDMATADDKAKLLAWKQYRVAVNRLSLSASEVAWPPVPAA